MGRTVADDRAGRLARGDAPVSGGARAGVLVIHPGALGDLLLAIPALRALRGGGPVTIAAQPRIGRLLRALAIVDGDVSFDDLQLHALFATATERAVDARIRDARRVISWFGARDPTYVGRLTALSTAAVIAPSIPDAHHRVWEHLVETVGGDAADRVLRRPVAVPPDIVAAGHRTLRTAGWDGTAPLLLVHAGASSARKRWPVESFARVVLDAVRTHGVRALLHEGPTDGGVIDALRSHVGHDVLELRDPDLPLLAGVLRHATLHLGNDSGVSHLAAAIGVRSVILFAPEKMAWHPWASAARIVLVGTGASDEDVAAVSTAARQQLGSPPPSPSPP